MNIISRSNSAKARLAELRKNGGLKAALRSPSGAIDLASIMVGVLVIGIIGGVIAATVFAVIPWSQDEAAKGALDSVRTAESVQFAMSTGDGNATYLSMTELATTSAAGEALIQASDKVYIAASASTYTAVTRSDSGKFYSIASANPANVVEYVDLAAANTALETALGGTLAWTAGALVFTATP